MNESVELKKILRLFLTVIFCIGIFIVGSVTSHAASSETITLYPGESYSTEVFCPDVFSYATSNKPLTIKSTDESVARPATDSTKITSSGLVFDLNVYAVSSGYATIQIYNSMSGEVYALVGVTVNSPKIKPISVCQGQVISLPVGYVSDTYSSGLRYAFETTGIDKTIYSLERVSTSSYNNLLIENCPYLIKENVEMSFHTLGNYSLFFYDPDKNHVATYHIQTSEHKYSASLKEEATCINKAKIEFKCENCTDSYTEDFGDYGNHKWNEYYTIDQKATCTEVGKKSIHCSLCDEQLAGTETKINALDHDYEAVVIDPTCTEEGSEYRRCTACDLIIDATTIEKLGHDYSKEWTIDKQATCTEEGSKSQHCTLCGLRSNITKIPVLSHTYGDWIITKEVTCTEDGTQYKECSCGHKITKKIESQGHEITIYMAQEATCEANGQIAKACANCDYVIYEPSEPLGHVEKKEPKVLEKATFDKYGSVMYECERCGGSLRSDAPSYINLIMLNATKFTYDGKTKTPTVVIKDYGGNNLVAGKDYTIKYNSSTRKAIGRYSVKITFKGKYSGSKVLYFKIVPKAVSISKLSAGKKVFTVKWKKPSSTYRKQMTGYQIKYSTSSKMSKAKTVTVKSTTATSKKISKLKAKKMYYVQLRTYKKVGSTTYYSSWSKVKKVKTK